MESKPAARGDLARSSEVRQAQLRVDGELDLANAHQLCHAAAELIAEGCRELALDLHAATFIDAAGIGALVAIQTDLLAADGRMTVDCPTGQPLRLLRLTKMDSALDVRTSDSPSALSAVG